MIWFTSDTHFNHANIIKYSERPFENINEMTEVMITNWNSRVMPGDVVYHLGDFGLSYGRRHAATIDSLLARLVGNKFLIRGNHDREEVYKNTQWTKVEHYHELTVKTKDNNAQKIVLAHYAHRVWNKMHYGSWMLHGHSHGSLDDIGGKTVDVGVDCWNYAPVSLDELTIFMRDRPVITRDHHKPETDNDNN